MLQSLKCFLLNDFKVESKFVHEGTDLLEFTINNLNFLAEYRYKSDPTFFRIMLPQIQAISSDMGNEILNKVMEVNSMYKVGKIIRIGNHLWISAEFFVDFNKNINDLLFNRAISLLQDMYNEFINKE